MQQKVIVTMKYYILAFVLFLIILSTAVAQDEDFCVNCAYNEDGTPIERSYEEWVAYQQRLIDEGYSTIFDTYAYQNGDYYVREDGRIALGSNPQEVLEDGSIEISSRPTTDEERKKIENEFWSWGVRKFTPEEQQEYNEKYDSIKSGIQPVYISQKQCVVEGTIDTIIKEMNLISDMITDLDEDYNLPIDRDYCTFENFSSGKGCYTCPINASTGMWVYTDKNRNAEVIQIYGSADNDKPKYTTYQWAYIASIYACLDMKKQDVHEMFLSAWNTGEYVNNDVEFTCGMDPYLDNTWVYIISNK